MFFQFGVGEVEWSAHSPNPNQNLWDELEPGFITQHQNPALLMELLLNENDALQPRSKIVWIVWKGFAEELTVLQHSNVPWLNNDLFTYNV